MTLHPKILELRSKVGSTPIHKSTPVIQPPQIRASSSQESDNPRLMKRYFAVWGEKDDYGTVPMKGCFKKSIKERGPKSSAAQKITVLYAHNQSKPLCVPDLIKEDEIGLYAEFIPDEGVQHCDEAVIQMRSGTINGGSYGFNYVWDSMVWNEKKEVIEMNECYLYELSPVVFGAQSGTFAVRNSITNVFEDEFLSEETEQLLKCMPRDKQLEMRNLIDRHISLAKLNQPNYQERSSLDDKPKHGGIDYKYLITNLKEETK